jgi:hypothetical protein
MKTGVSFLLIMHFCFKIRGPPNTDMSRQKVHCPQLAKQRKYLIIYPPKPYRKVMLTSYSIKEYNKAKANRYSKQQTANRYGTVLMQYPVPNSQHIRRNAVLYQVPVMSISPTFCNFPAVLRIRDKKKFLSQISDTRPIFLRA